MFLEGVMRELRQKSIVRCAIDEEDSSLRNRRSAQPMGKVDDEDTVECAANQEGFHSPD
jgi:hypothetical protein